jgi:predicted  nucleic acid-binding Zn-ribbon protein
MEKKVEQEGKTDEELYHKFMCYCKTGAAGLQKSIQDAETRIPQLESAIEAGTATKQQLNSDITQAKADIKAAQTTIAESTALREKTASDFEAESSQMKADISAMGKAITSISKGMSGFLQTPAATVLRRLAVSTDLSSDARDTLTSFLSQSSDSEDDDSYEPASGEINGILKQMKETMEKDLADATAAEQQSIKDYNALMAAKKKEIAALTKQKETKIARVGEVSVQLVNDKSDLVNTEKNLAEDKKFLSGLAESCQKKEKEYEAVQQVRSEEMKAIADTIKLLNDDDALELFKKTLPKPSFLQMASSGKEVMRRARHALRSSLTVHDYRLDLISMSMKGKNVDFDKISVMIDDMVALLKKEQVDDDRKKAYCAKSFDKAEDEKKELSRTHSDLQKTIADEKEAIGSLTSDIQSLEDGIKALDKAVAEATENRKAENKIYQEEMANNNAAIEIIGMAKNRLNKFYNPKLYKPAPKRKLSEEDRITVNFGGTLAPTAAPGGIADTGVTAPAVDSGAALVQDGAEDKPQDENDDAEQQPSFMQMASKSHRRKAAPPPPPEAKLAYEKKNGESGGVMAMMDVLTNELKKETTEMKFDEKDAQEDYEKLMTDSSTKRAADAKSIAEKEAARADETSKLQKHNEELKATSAELMANAKYEHDLHGECDWLLQNMEVRKKARADEIDSLTKAKAVLHGADFNADE